MSDRHTSSGFRYRLWCRDCGNGEDPYGCFDGDVSAWSDEAYPTREAAEAAACKRIDGAPWEYEIEEQCT